jgi:voltage-gated potassium channel
MAFEMLERDVVGSRTNIIVNGLIVCLILGSVLSVVLESNAGIAAAYSTIFWNFEVLCVAVFTVEFFARIWSSPDNPRFRGMAPWQARLRYLATPLAVIDFISIAPFYLHLIIPMDLRFVRILRLLRLFKLSHYFRSLTIFIDVLRSEARTLFSVILTAFVLIIVSACVMYLVEHTAQPDAFGDVPSAIWWAVVTMTTVGYGDVMPVTGLGKIIAIFVMLVGVGLVALPAAMLAAKFAEELHTRTRALERKVDKYLADGLIDDNERAKIKQLGDRLGLSDATVSRLTEDHRLELTCPHCGKPIFKALAADNE